jgi:uncharacterized protein involved in exopolysaccharide biosynthesis
MHMEDDAPRADARDATLDIIDFQYVWTIAGFAVRSVRRHRLLAVCTVVLTLAAAAAFLRVWPKTYHVEATLLARRNDLMTSLSNPSRPLRPEADDPTRAASELVHNRENLFALARSTNLLAEMDRTRSPLGRLRDSVMERLRPTTVEDRLNAVIWLLDQRLVVTVEKEGVVRIAIDWSEPHLATELVQAAVENYISARHDTEAATISEAITILQGSAASLQQDVDRTIGQLRQEQAARPPTVAPRRRALERTPAPAPTPVIPPPAPAPAVPDAATIAELGRLTAAIEATQQQISKIEGTRRQQLADLQSRLNTARTLYTEDHPTVVGLRQSIAAVAPEPTELTTLKSEAQLLEKQYQVLEVSRQPLPQASDGGAAALAAVMQLAPPSRVAPPAASDAAEPPAPLVAVLPGDLTRLTDMSHPASRLLTLQLAQLANLLDRINSARLELATSGAGLKFRYTVTRPAEVPKSPVKPNALLVIAGALLASLVLAVAGPLAIDLSGGRVLEPWQLERQLRVPVLGTMEFVPHE